MGEQSATGRSRIQAVNQIVAREYPNTNSSSPVLVGQGVVSHVYRVDIDGQSLAVKLQMTNRESMSAYEIDEYAREHRWLTHAASVGIPCPRVLATGWLGSTSYIIQTFISGVNGEESSLDPLLLWRELGRLARLIHSIPVEDADAKWRKYLARVIAGMTDHDVKIALGVYRASQQDEIKRVFEKLGAVAFRYGLNHCDLHPKNTLVDENGTVFLLDWGSTSRDVNLVPHGELVSLLWYHGPKD